MAILISTPQDLHNIRNNLSGEYELVNDIDMSGWANFNPIGSSYSNPFKGSLNGKGHKIKNLNINKNSAYVGLFGYSDGGTFQNISVENANVTGNSNNYVGIIVGYFINSTIKSSSSEGSVSGQYGVGGLIGWHAGGTIENCFSNASANGVGRVGGIVGNLLTTTSFINNSYAIGSVSATNSSYPAGGIVGTLGNGVQESNVVNSYYNSDVISVSAGGEGKTTSELKLQSTYRNWDFTSTWGINGDYPYLQVFGVPQAPAKIETINLQAHAQGINSSISHSKVAAKQFSTYSQPLYSVLNRKLSTSRIVEGYLSQISSSVISSHKTVRNGSRNVQSTIQPISSSLFRAVRVHRNLTSNMNAISCEINALYPINVISPNAYLSIVENVSRTFKMDNKSNAYYILNPSLWEVRK
jgi:hypothetical protein